eukprot:4399108-Pyramimonas_sp.AAC.1
MFSSACLRAWVSVIAPMQGSPSGPVTIIEAGVGLGAIRVMISWQCLGSLWRAAVVVSSARSATAWRRSARVARLAASERSRALVCAARSAPVGTLWSASQVAHLMASCFCQSDRVGK